MCDQIIYRYNKAYDQKLPQEILNKIFDEMCSFANRDLLFRYECDMEINLNNDSPGTNLMGLVMSKVILFTTKYKTKWFSENFSNNIIALMQFLHKPYSNYIRNYTRDIFRIILSDVNISSHDLVSLRNAIEESYDKNPISYEISNEEDEKVAEFSAFLSDVFSTNAKKIEEYEKEYPLFKSKYVSTVENLAGSLIGKAVGDSIGFFVEGQGSDFCCEYIKIVTSKTLHLYGIDKSFGHSTRPRYCKIEGNEDLIAFLYGQYTDDTQCARELLLSVDKEKLNVECFKQKLVSLYGLSGLIEWDKKSTVKSGIVGHGGIQPMQNMANGVPWNEAGQGGGNGACMRVAPLGALYMNRKDICVEVANLQAVGTHNCPKARASAVLIAETTRLSLENIIKPYARYSILNHPRIFCKQLASSIKTIDPRMENYILTLPNLVELRNKMITESKKSYEDACIFADRKIVEMITSEAATTFGDTLWHQGKVISCSAAQACLFAIYCFLCIPDFYLSSICMAIRVGGDTDTTAAIVGGIVGARLGLKSIPNYFVEKINDQGNYKADELIDICKQLLS